MGDFVIWDDFGIPVATTHESVSAVLRSRNMGREVPASKKLSVPQGLEPFYDLEAHSMLELEGPTHTRLRGLVLRAFTRNRVSALAPQISMIADDLIDKFPDGTFDLLQYYARQLPAITIARLLGVPDEVAPNLLIWSNAMVAMYQSRRDREVEELASKASQEFSDFLRSYVESRRGNPKDDLISQLIAAEENGERLSTDELISTCILLLNAGHEATVHSIGNAVKHLVDFPRRKDALSPDHIEYAVEECFRFDPP
ncbi:MAG: cytochrome P450, partial [Pseudomonadota bacterium]